MENQQTPKKGVKKFLAIISSPLWIPLVALVLLALLGGYAYFSIQDQFETNRSYQDEDITHTYGSPLPDS